MTPVPACAGLSGAWMLQRAMSVDATAGPGYDRTFINRLLAENFQVCVLGPLCSVERPAAQLPGAGHGRAQLAGLAEPASIRAL